MILLSLFEWPTFAIAVGGFILSLINTLLLYQKYRIRLVLKPKLKNERLAMMSGPILHYTFEVINKSSSVIYVKEVGYILNDHTKIPDNNFNLPSKHGPIALPVPVNSNESIVLVPTFGSDLLNYKKSVKYLYIYTSDGRFKKHKISPNDIDKISSN